MQRPVVQRSTKSVLQEGGLFVVFGAILSGLILLQGPSALVALTGICLLALAGFVAYRYPTFTVCAWGFLSIFLYELTGFRSYGKIGAGIDLDYGDPALAGIALALLAALAFNNERSWRVHFGLCLFWTLLVGWLFLEIFRSVPEYGVVSSLGEFRRFFRAVLVLPYIVVFFRTREQQWRLFKVLTALCLLLIPIALLKGGLLFEFGFAAYSKWLFHKATLTLVWGGVALFVMTQKGLWEGKRLTPLLLLITALALVIICGHRSVWLASGFAMLGLLVLGEVTWHKTVLFGAGLLVAGLLASQIYPGNLLGFFAERITAFTSFQEDSTASWRFHIWQDALHRSADYLLEGKGLGSYFETTGPDGRVVTTALHNQYIQLIYQTGLIGLILYLGMTIQAIRHLWKTSRTALDPRDYTMVVVALVVLFGGSAYYIAYVFDEFTWLFVGLGLAVAQTASERAANSPSSIPRQRRSSLSATSHG